MTTPTIQALRAAIASGKLGVKDQAFAESLAAGHDRYDSWTAKQEPYVLKMIERAANPPAPQVHAAPVKVGDMSGVIALFDRARKHLKRPAIVIGCSGLSSPIRLTIAGDKAKVPGSVTVTSAEYTDAENRERDWFGRVLRDGQFEPSRTGARVTDRIVSALTALALDPGKVAAEHGRLTGRCCFCNRALSDERSTAVGYGRKCAENFGVEWGQRPAEFAAAPGELPLGFDESAAA